MNFCAPSLTLALLLTAGVCHLGAQSSDPVAGLVWVETTVEIETAGSPDKKVVEFHFRNTSDRTISILGVKTTCGCTAGRPAKQSYAPGEEGVLLVEHRPKVGQGLHLYRINVVTDEGRGHSQELILRVASTPRIAIEPRLLTWTKGEERAPKTVIVRTRPDSKIKVTGAEPDKNIVSVEMAGALQPGEKILRLIPKPGTDSASGRVRLRLTTEPPLAPAMDTEFFAILR
ncbi:MAG: DUF1573 domain-containing protein [Chthoniobacterales bacterium]